MHWLFVLLAGFIEIFWVMGLKIADSPLDWIFVIGLIVLSFYLLITANKTIPVGTTYAVFTGIGTAGVIIVGILFFNEPFSITKLIFILFIVVGVLGLKLSSEENADVKEEVKA